MTSGSSPHRTPGVVRGPWVDAARHWIAFIGPRRLVGGVLSALAVCVGGWVLLRPAGAPVESLIPRAPTASTPEGAPTAGGEGTTSAGLAPNGALPAPQIIPDIKVHVAGAVKSPGVYSLPPGSRVVDAVRAAGGATGRADLERINLAQTIIDTEQVYVPVRRSGSPTPTVSPRLRPERRRASPVSTVPGTIGTPPSPDGTSDPSRGARINLNSATAAQLDDLPGIGPATARAIVAHRARKGPFAKVEDLLNVSGIGPAKLAALRDLVTV